MKKKDPLLRIQFDGKAVGESRIPVSYLLTFLSNMEKAIKRTSRVLSGEASSLQKGRVPENIKKEIALDLVQITHASPSAVLGLERSMSQAAFPGMAPWSMPGCFPRYGPWSRDNREIYRRARRCAGRE
jgi:tRNA A37 threonylcarbamoyladenosine synthetase subunit TsaC/SUA5/YrdC